MRFAVRLFGNARYDAGTDSVACSFPRFGVCVRFALALWHSGKYGFGIWADLWVCNGRAGPNHLLRDLIAAMNEIKAGDLA